MEETLKIAQEEIATPEKIKNVQNMLNEEKWTRATIGNYSISNFKELDKIIDEAQSEGIIDDLKKLSDEHLSHTKNSIIALYISGITACRQQLLDDSALRELINIFTDNHKTQVVEYICERALDYGEFEFALRTLAECYRAENNKEKLYPVWERLVKVDYDEADIAKLLAEHYEKEGDLENTIDYYKKALYRYINRRQTGSVREVWSRLLGIIPEEISFFQHVQRKIAKTLGKDKSAVILHELYEVYKAKADWDTAIDILKQILSYDEKDSWARREIVSCFREKYSKHSMLEEYIVASSLTQSFRNVFEAILEFEKHIAFDTGNFVFHNTWGVGRIAKVDRNNLVIDFAKKRGHSMSLKMGVNALQTLSRDHIWVLKSIWKKDKLKQKVKEDPEWALRVIIKSYNNCCHHKRIKDELVPSVLEPSEWTSWNTKAKVILKDDPAFGVNPDNIDEYIVRDSLISIEEKIYNEFKAQKDFFPKIDLLIAFSKKGDTESEYFSEMFEYFISYLKTLSQVNEKTIASYLVVKEVAAEHPHLNLSVQYNFAELFSKIEDYSLVYSQIKDSNLRRSYLQHIKNFVPQWADVYAKLFPEILSTEIIEALLKNGYEDKVKEIAALSFENYRNYREAVVWFFKNVQGEEWFSSLEIPYEKQLITLIHILDITFKEIANHKNTVENKKINRQIISVLFGKDNLLEEYMLDNDTDTITRLYTLVDDVKDLAPALKMQLRNKILEKHKDFKFYGIQEKTDTAQGLLVTSKMMEEKQKELRRLIDEEIPENRKELAYALSLGDLRENAEYKAAKERQSMLDNRVRTYQEEIDRAQIVDPAAVSANRVAFGTVVRLQNNITNEEETLTILGPWESNTDAGIISYLSPLGLKLCGNREGDTLRFSINNSERNYTVKSISVADF